MHNPIMNITSKGFTQTTGAVRKCYDCVSVPDAAVGIGFVTGMIQGMTCKEFKQARLLTITNGVVRGFFYGIGSEILCDFLPEYMRGIVPVSLILSTIYMKTRKTKSCQTPTPNPNPTPSSNNPDNDIIIIPENLDNTQNSETVFYLDGRDT